MPGALLVLSTPVPRHCLDFFGLGHNMGHFGVGFNFFTASIFSTSFITLDLDKIVCYSQFSRDNVKFGLGHNVGAFGGEVRLALLALSVLLAFAQAVVDNANNTSLTPLVH